MSDVKTPEKKYLIQQPLALRLDRLAERQAVGFGQRAIGQMAKAELARQCNQACHECPSANFQCEMLYHINAVEFRAGCTASSCQRAGLDRFGRPLRVRRFKTHRMDEYGGMEYDYVWHEEAGDLLEPISPAVGQSDDDLERIVAEEVAKTLDNDVPCVPGAGAW
jgi:hypothetical protein